MTRPGGRGGYAPRPSEDAPGKAMGDAEEVDEGGLDDAGVPRGEREGDPAPRPVPGPAPLPGGTEAPVPDEDAIVSFEDAVVHRDDDGRERPSPFVGCLGGIALVGLVVLSAAAVGGVGYVVIQLVQALLA
jgi:hypothetical protein